MSALISFLGGSAFRMIWGEVSAFLTAKQNHKHELQRLSLQERIDGASHARNLEAMRLQSDLGIKVIESQRDAHISQSEVDAWAQAVSDVGKSTGIQWLDILNGSVRPILAYLSIAMVVASVIQNGWVLTALAADVVCAILGIYVADRSLSKRGK